MEYIQRTNPRFSACGLNCGLCPRYHTAGESKCPGCAGEGFLTKHPTCGVLSCCQRHGLEYCCFCDQFPCKKYDGADLMDSFISHRNQFRDFETLRRIGPEAYAAALDRKVELLQYLLDNFDDGRRKRFFCTAVNLLELEDMRAVLKEIERETGPDDPVKQRASLAAKRIDALAEERGISLKLRKK